MKTLKQIILTAAFIALTANFSFAGSLTTFRMFLQDGTVINVLTRVESLVEENIPDYTNILKRFNQSSIDKLSLPQFSEKPVEEEIHFVESVKHLNTVNELHLVLNLTQGQEELISEELSEIDTYAIYQQYLEEKRQAINNKLLSSFQIKETELIESLPLEVEIGQFAK